MMPSDEERIAYLDTEIDRINENLLPDKHPEPTDLVDEVYDMLEELSDRTTFTSEGADLVSEIVTIRNYIVNNR